MNSSEKRRGREAAGQSPEEKKRAWGCRPATVSREITAPARAVRSARPPRPALEPSPTRAPLVDGRRRRCLQTLAHPPASTNRLPRRSARHLPPARRPTARTSSPSKPTAFPSATVVERKGERKGRGKEGKRKETDSDASEAATCRVFFCDFSDVRSGPWCCDVRGGPDGRRCATRDVVLSRAAESMARVALF